MVAAETSIKPKIGTRFVWMEEVESTEYNYPIYGAKARFRANGFPAVIANVVEVLMHNKHHNIWVVRHDHVAGGEEENVCQIFHHPLYGWKHACYKERVKDD